MAGRLKKYPVPEKIKEAASSGELAVFIGAGLSRCISLPSWQEMAQAVLKQIYKKDGLVDYREAA